MPLHLESSTLTECGPHRTASRCVSWNASGQYVAFGTSDRLVRLCTVEGQGGTAREVLVVTGHQAAVTQVKFHPVEKTLVRVFVCVLSAAILWLASLTHSTHSTHSTHAFIHLFGSCLPIFLLSWTN
jgi:WD40 repeat protein